MLSAVTIVNGKETFSQKEKKENKREERGRVKGERGRRKGSKIADGGIDQC